MDKFYSKALLKSSGSPEGVAGYEDRIGRLCVDETNGALYIKSSGSSNTGWNKFEATGGGSVPVTDLAGGSAADQVLYWNGSVVAWTGSPKLSTRLSIGTNPA